MAHLDVHPKGNKNTETFMRQRISQPIAGQQIEGMDDLHMKRKAFSKCFDAKVNAFLDGKRHSDKDAFGLTIGPY